MQLTPRYDGPPIIELVRIDDDPAVPLVRQRRRLAAILATFDDSQWAAPSRCAGWSAQDVTAHLVTTTQFWAISFAAGLAGAPTRYLGSFDPVASPQQMVEAVRGVSPDATLAQFVEAIDGMDNAVSGLSADDWSVLAEAPPGHVSLHAVALHALWDSWIHERDVLLPLGIAPVVEPDEVEGCLRYVAALGAAFLASTGSERRGSLAVVGHHPDIRFVVEAGPTVVVRGGDAPADGVTVEGDTVALIEALSYRAPLAATVPDDALWMVGGLGQVFDQAV
jgi:uncharacterized protein (TIGR03083 family)